MPSFIYLGGTEFDGTELPAKVKLFGISFVEGVAKPVTLADFKTSIAYEHAVKKLATQKSLRSRRKLGHARPSQRLTRLTLTHPKFRTPLNDCDQC
jgi:hypothetical protein